MICYWRAARWGFAIRLSDRPFRCGRCDGILTEVSGADRLGEARTRPAAAKREGCVASDPREAGFGVDGVLGEGGADNYERRSQQAASVIVASGVSGPR